MAYLIKRVGKEKKKLVMISQTGPGWNVSTTTVKGNRVTTHARKDTRTLAMAKKEFTRQKRRFSK